MFHSSTDTERHPSVQETTPDLAVGESHPHFEGRLQSDDQNLWTREAEIRLFAELHGRTWVSRGMGGGGTLVSEAMASRE